MGSDKAFIKVEGIPIIERIVTLFKECFREILIISDQRNLFSHLDATVYGDLIPERGALGGLYTGLFFASFPTAFCVACDMPFLNRSLLEFLIDSIDGFEAVVPRTSDGLQPLHAVYSKACLKPMKRLMDRGGNRIFDFYSDVKVRFVQEDEFRRLDPKNRSFININTPEDLALINTKGGVH